MTANQDLYAAAQAAIEKRRARVAAGTPLVEPGEFDLTRRRSIEQEGTCDGCAESRPLVLAIDLPDSEPWLCRECADYDAFITAAVNALPADTEALAAVLERHALVESRHVKMPDWCHRCPTTAWPCPDALAALTALGVAPC